MGRQSAASLEVASISIPQRPEPPDSLTPSQAITWRKIAATKPPDWFSADVQPILEAYCKAIDFQRTITSEREQMVIEAGVVAAKELHGIEEKNAKLIATLATKMRLTPQSRYTPKTAMTAHKRSGGGEKKPWEI